METGKTTIAERMVSISRFIRLPNLLIIVLTQFLLRYCLFAPFIYTEDTEVMSTLLDFSVLCLATLFITSGGYIINDYFDVRIDEINKPKQLIIGTIVPGRTAIKWHILLTGLGSLLGLYLAYRIRLLSFGLIFPAVGLLLWFYSAKYKRMFFWGNFIVALLSALVVLIVYVFEFFWLRLHPDFFADLVPDLFWVGKLFLAYALFAFLVTFYREIIKDMEDVKGDARVGCRSIPIVLGINTSRWIVAGLVALSIILLVSSLVILYRLGLMMVFLYLVLTTLLPMIYLIYRAFRSNTPEEYHIMSNICKIIMVAGVLSMQLIAISKLYDK
ncbi:MAG: geranylgeranylglycerol-phosphate geranylgeranyltransferase [Bacteroidetes bacterium]|nr:geranylgeranylglycerol-phosphate geranylgeranyltransferase [Bacteroidota bacterium]